MQKLGRLIWLIITIILVMVAAALAVSNETRVILYLWPFEGALKAPVWLVIISSFIIGGILSIVLLWTQWLAIRTKLWRLQNKFDKLQAQAMRQKYSDDAQKSEPGIAINSSNYRSKHGVDNLNLATSDQNPHDPQAGVSFADLSHDKSKSR